MRKQVDLVCELDSGTRVTSDDLQWIIEHRQGRRWEQRSFCRQRDSLLRLLEAYENLEAIELLPEWHP